MHFEKGLCGNARLAVYGQILSSHFIVLYPRAAHLPLLIR
jgi:hypothetical protein